MALVPASSHGAAAFNGGTITAPLTISDPATAAGSYQLLNLEMGGANQDALVFTDSRDGAGNDVIAAAINGSGTGRANFSVNDDAGFGSVGLDSQQGINYLAPSDGATVFTVTPTTLGFYRHAAAAQAAAIADAAGGAIIDAQARTALNSLLAAMRAVGLIAT